MLKKQTTQFLSLAALLIGLLVVFLLLTDPSENESPVDLSEKTSAPAEILKTEDAAAQKSSPEKLTNDSQRDVATSESGVQPAEFSEDSPEALESARIEEALIQRQLTKAKIAAEYSSAGDGTLTEADLRRYAEERYLKRRDLNGNGRLDGFELRAIGQDNGDVAIENNSASTNNLREL